MPVENSVSVEAGSTRVDGYLTQFVAVEGDTLIINGISALVQRRDSTSQITLKRPWPGPSVVESTNWDLTKTGPSWSSTVQVNTKITQLIERLEAGGVLKPDRAGPLSERDQYNDQGEGFLFLRTDVDPFLMYVKTGPGPADWSTGQRIQGDPAQSTVEAQQAAAAAQGSAAAASGSATAAASSAGGAATSAQRAADWAEKPVDQDVTTPGTRSAKHHAIKADAARAAAELAASQAQQGVVPDNGVTTAKIADGAVTSSKLRDSISVSVIGRASGTNGPPADIQATADGHVLRRSGAAVGFGTVATTGLADDAVTNAKLANMATSTMKGRKTAGAGDPEDLTAADVRQIIGAPFEFISDTTIPTNTAFVDISLPANFALFEFDILGIFPVSAGALSARIIAGTERVSGYYETIDYTASANTIARINRGSATMQWQLTGTVQPDASVAAKVAMSLAPGSATQYPTMDWIATHWLSTPNYAEHFRAGGFLNQFGRATAVRLFGPSNLGGGRVILKGLKAP